MLKDKNVLVVGVARSGLAAGLLAQTLGAKVTLNDVNAEVEIQDEHLYKSMIWDLGGQPKTIDKYDLLVLSPGVPTDLAFIQEARSLNIKVIGALEFGYLHTQGTFYGITGTNGKTTTTQLTYEIFLQDKFQAYAVGNIGKPVCAVAMDAGSDKHMITEMSSFQLESIEKFRPKVACLLNIRPDHLNRHKTMENYFAAKCRIYENQGPDDFLLINGDDEGLKTFKPETQGQCYYFSKTPLKSGFYVENDHIVAHINKAEVIMPVGEIKIVGQHSLENVLAAVGVAYLAGVSVEAIRRGVGHFKGVEHRIEYLGMVKGLACYNDSKGTNPDATHVAITSMDRPTVLIAGGMDKGSEFDDLSSLYAGRLSHLVLLGQTKEKMKAAALKVGFDKVVLVETMDQAVEKAFELAQEGGAILLSPACASWDMYASFEVRGQHFKTCIEKAAL